MRRLLRKLFGRKPQQDRTWTEVVFIEEQSTPVTRNVNCLLLQMSETDSCTKVLSRREKLSQLTYGVDTFEPPSIEAVLKRLKELCGLKSEVYSAPIEGTIPVTIQGRTFSVHCLFDESPDICCRIRMERTKEK